MFPAKSAETYPKIIHCDQNIFSVSFRQSRKTIGKYRQSFDKITELIPGKTDCDQKFRQNLESLGDINPEKSFSFTGKININPALSEDFLEKMENVTGKINSVTGKIIIPPN